MATHHVPLTSKDNTVINRIQNRGTSAKTYFHRGLLVAICALGAACASSSDQTLESGAATGSNAAALQVNVSNGFAWGVNGHANWTGVADGTVDLDTQMQLLQAAGLKIYRLDVSRTDAVTSARLGNVISTAAKYNIQVLPVILGLSHDGDGNLLLQDGTVATPQNAHDYSKDLALHYADAYGDAMPVFEAGNEYDDLTINRGTDGASYSHYNAAKFWIAHESLRGTLEGIKASKYPNIKSVVSYTWCHYGYTDMMWNGMTPDNQTANAVAPIKWDITGQHWYYGMNNGNPTAAGCWAGPTNILEVDKSHYGKPIWITEFGDEVAAASANKPLMASDVESMMERISTVGNEYNVQSVLLYELFDSGASGAQGNFGLCTKDGTCNNDYYRMVSWFTGTKQAQLRWTTTMTLANSQCLDVTGASTASGALIEQYSCNGQTNQQWVLKPVGANYEIISSKSGLCLEVTGASTASGSTIDQGTCSGASHQLWNISAQPNGTNVITGVASHRCLHVPNASYNAKSPGNLIIADCSGVVNQQYITQF